MRDGLIELVIMGDRVWEFRKHLFAQITCKNNIDLGEMSVHCSNRNRYAVIGTLRLTPWPAC